MYHFSCCMVSTDLKTNKQKNNNTWLWFIQLCKQYLCLYTMTNQGRNMDNGKSHVYIVFTIVDQSRQTDFIFNEQCCRVIFTYSQSMHNCHVDKVNKSIPTNSNVRFLLN